MPCRAGPSPTSRLSPSRPRNPARGYAHVTIHVGSAVKDVTIIPLTAPNVEGTVLSFGSTVRNDDGTALAPSIGSSYSWSITRDGVPYALPPDTSVDGPSLTFTPADNGTYRVVLLVLASDQGAGSAALEVVVANASPVVTSAVNQSADEGSPKGVALGSFADVAGDGPWTVEVNWGDGATSIFTVTQTGSLPDARTLTLTTAAIPSRLPSPIRMTEAG
jgi:hypothetical protein